MRVKRTYHKTCEMRFIRKLLLTRTQEYIHVYMYGMYMYGMYMYGMHMYVLDIDVNGTRTWNFEIPLRHDIYDSLLQQPKHT
jgi:hypothetical protein